MHHADRRKWFKQCLSAAALCLVPGAARVRAEATAQRLRVIPSSGERVPAVGLGTARTFNAGGGEDALAPLRAVMRLFVERGGTLVDTSPMYGQAERVVGELVSGLGVGDKIFFATKVWTRGEADGMQQMETSFRLLATNRIDLMQVHNLLDTGTQLKSVRRLREQGKVRYIGITHYTASAFGDLEAWIRKEKLEYVQFPYSIASRQAEARLLPVAAEHGVAVIAHRNFDQGALFRKVKGKALPPWADEFDCASWGNFFLKYVLGDPRVTNVIPATTKTSHLEDNMNAGLGRLPDQAQRRKMVEYVESL